MDVVTDVEKTPPFEKRLEELNALIKQLEKGDLGLEEAILTFERGKTLHAELVKQLGGFERKIEMLTRELDGQDQTKPAPNLDPDRNRNGRDIPF
jgi:exodeoxyribonuclease VII small subunit